MLLLVARVQQVRFSLYLVSLPLSRRLLLKHKATAARLNLLLELIELVLQQLLLRLSSIHLLIYYRY